MSTINPIPVNKEQADALRHWANVEGKNWKEALLNAWFNGGDHIRHYSYHLQRIRNTLGPSWLHQLKADLSNLMET
jgi:hypothetical protein